MRFFIGTTLSRAIWRPFEREFAAFEVDLREQGAQLQDEIRLASEQAASREREAVSSERYYEKSFRAEVRKDSEARAKRQLRKDRAKASKLVSVLRRKYPL